MGGGEELPGQDLTARRYIMQSLFRRLGQKEDPWARIDDEAVLLEAPAAGAPRCLNAPALGKMAAHGLQVVLRSRSSSAACATSAIEVVSTVLKHAEAHVSVLSGNQLIQQGGTIYEIGKGPGNAAAAYLRMSASEMMNEPPQESLDGDEKQNAGRGRRSGRDPRQRTSSGDDRVGPSAVDVRAREIRAHEGIVEVHNGPAISMPTPE